MAVNCVSGWAETQESLMRLVLSDAPELVARMGGSDTDAVAAWLNGNTQSAGAGREAAASHLGKLKAFNGYYDFSNNYDRYIEFIELLYATYMQSTEIAFVDAKLLTMYFRNNLNEKFRLDEIPNRAGFELLFSGLSASLKPVNAYPYTFFQTLSGPQNLIRVFEQTLSGMKVLAITPFKESIEKNWNNRSKFFKSFDYPDFTLSCVNTPITYDGLPEEFYPHSNWFETLSALCREVDTLDFDIALLSCGSYAMPLGTHIVRSCKRKAIYVGGILQLFFGIMGRRYDNPFFLDAIYAENFIEPVEKEKFLGHVPLNLDAPKEHFGAYF